MTEPLPAGWTERLTAMARALPYPPTPRLAASASPRPARRPALAGWQLALLAVILVALGLLAVPPVRAGVARFIQIGVVRIFVGPTPLAPTAATGPATATAAPAETQPPTATATPLPSLLDTLGGETTLADAQARAWFTVTLPNYPADLGQPARVFLQADGAPMVVLVWLDPAQPKQPRLALFEIAPGNFGLAKSEYFQGVPPNLQNATVHGQPAAWTTGPYLFQRTDGQLDYQRLIEGHVLIWLEQGLTYRLETPNTATLAETVRTAESLR